MNKSSGRIRVNGKLLTVKQTERFEFYMAHSENFRTRFMQLASQQVHAK